MNLVTRMLKDGKIEKPAEERSGIASFMRRLGIVIGILILIPVVIGVGWLLTNYFYFRLTFIFLLLGALIFWLGPMWIREGENARNKPNSS